MRIDRLTLTNFKCFAHDGFELHPRFTLFVGDNGSGKTSILEGLSVAAGSWLLGIQGQRPRSLRPEEVRFTALGGRRDHPDSPGIAEPTSWEPHYPCAVEAEGQVRGEARAPYGRPVTYFYDLRDAGAAALAFRADDPSPVQPALKQQLLDRLAAIADLEVAAGVEAQHGLPPTEPLAKAGPRELEIVRAVAQEERGRLGVGDRAPVSDPVALLESIDVRVIPFELDPAAGNLVSGFSAFSEALGAGIFVNTHPSLSIEHQIFCVLHEYAHLIFHRGVYREPGAPYRTRGSHASPEEKIANTFAGTFLVPDGALRQHAGGLGRISPTDVIRLKRLFRVSFTGMLTRLYQAGHITKADNGRLWSICKARGWDKQEPEPLCEPPAYGRRTEALARAAWERGEASLGFLGEVLGKDRRAMRDLAADWEQDVQVDAVH